MTITIASAGTARRGLLSAMSGEGLRLFFPLGAAHAAIWPLLWMMLWNFDLPLAGTSSPAQWHAQELLIGSFGAVLIGFMTSALPEWTDTPRLAGRPLFVLAGLWAVARLVGLVGATPASHLAGLADQAWLIFLLVYVAYLGWRRRTLAFIGFAGLLATLAFSAGALRLGLAAGDFDAGETAIRIAAFSFLGLLGLSLARITVPVTNLVLDPSETTSPYRPHPGRVNLAPGLICVLLAAEFAGLSEPVRGYLILAAGAAFLDRVAEGFVGREGLRWELAGLWLSSALAGSGLMTMGLTFIGLPLPWLGGLHLTLMGGLGLGILQVLSIAGLLHTGQPLVFTKTTKAALWLMLAAVSARVVPEFIPTLALPGGPHGWAAGLWTLSLTLWLYGYVPLLWSPATLDQETC